MAAIQDALKSLDAIPWEDIPTNDLKSFLSTSFSHGQLLVDSIPITDPSPSLDLPTRARSSSVASNASEISESAARTSPPSDEVEALKPSWGKPVRVKASENPLGVSVYKMAGNDGNGAWFARRSVHEGLGFRKWKMALEAEFPETMKTQGAPGEGNIRGIGGERRVEYQDVEGLGRMEVYHLSAQFPGPTTPRDFVTLLMTSESALDEKTAGADGGQIPRHFMVISRPMIHPECPERNGFIRGQYQSVEFIREIVKNKGRKKSHSTTDIPENTRSRNRSSSTALGREAILRHANKQQTEQTEREKSQPKGASHSNPDLPLPSEEDESEQNPIEWIMVTRSDPGGSVPRFMIERGTPGGIIGDATKFLNWACSRDIRDFATEIPEGEEYEESGNAAAADVRQPHTPSQELHGYQTNGHLSGLDMDGASDPQEVQHSGIYGMIAGVAGTAGATIAAYTPEVIKNHIPEIPSYKIPEEAEDKTETTRGNAFRRYSSDSISTVDTFASAETGTQPGPIIYASNSLAHRDADSLSASTGVSAAVQKLDNTQEKELQRLEDKKRKLLEKLNKDKEKELNRKHTDAEKEAAALKKAEERHARDVAKQEEKYRKEVEKLQQRKDKELKKAEEKRLKELDRDEKTKLSRELQEIKIELEVAAKERDMLREKCETLQRENTSLLANLSVSALDKKENINHPDVTIS